MPEVTEEMIKNGMSECECGEKLYFKKDNVYINDEFAHCKCGNVYLWRCGVGVPIIEIVKNDRSTSN
jgi:hypothetical protein